MSARGRPSDDGNQPRPAAETIERLQNVGVGVAREGARIRRQMAEEGADFGRLWFSWWPEQMQDSWRAAWAFARCRTIGEVAQVQTEFLRSSMERFSRCMNATGSAVIRPVMAAAETGREAGGRA